MIFFEVLKKYPNVITQKDDIFLDKDGNEVDVDISLIETNYQIQQQIDELEAQQTARLLREALNGEEYAKTKLAELDAQIAILRAKL